ncbi:MAG: putative ABC transporter permease [Saccharofermentans sp.]|nr:putative ABC transporter permease [Saccharofermentans sp.]
MERLIYSDYSVYDYIALVIVVSFLGFCLEDLWLLFRKRQIDNRNMNLPFLIGYGLAILFIYTLMGVPQKDDLLLYFAACFFIVSIGEILLGFSVEKFCGIYYWDYSSLPLHVTRYTSLFTSLGFSAIITGFFYYFFKPLMSFIQEHASHTGNIACVLLISVMVADFFYSFKHMHDTRSLYQWWILHLPSRDSDRILEVVARKK